MKCLVDIALHAKGLNASGAQPTGKWTLPMICDHLAKAMTGSTGVLGPGPATKPAPLFHQMVGRLVVMKIGFVPGGIKSPERVLPRADVCFDDAIQSLEAAIAMCEQKTKSGEPWLVHPLLGFSDARSWERFHLVHAKHHFAKLRTR